MELSSTLWQIAKLLLLAGSALIAFLFVQYVHLMAVVQWGSRSTQGLKYYGQPPKRRNRFKRTLAWHSFLLAPILYLLGRSGAFTFQNASFTYCDVAGPKGSSTVEDFQRACRYAPRADDVFVVTQMKCGTTWMQHTVYEVLHRGDGDLVESGQTLYAVSPWLESCRGVAVDNAPLLGRERPSRVIKTHLPTQLCPYAPEAKYIYVVRHPVSCFASCIDFVTANLRGFAPSIEACETWFQSPQLMWWTPWTSHVKGWWEWSEQHSNVLFVSFEEMKRHFPAVVRQVAQFLDMNPLENDEMERIVHKCGFEYMRSHSDTFEMNPPHLLQSTANFFQSGKSDRHADAPTESRQRIARWCRAEMAGSDFPLAQFYPDVA